MVKKKDINEIKDNVKLLSHNWESFIETQRKSTVLASDTAMNVLKDSDFNTAGFTGDTLSEINRLTLPSYMTWDYWIMINQWADYWVNHYKFDLLNKDGKDETDNKDNKEQQQSKEVSENGVQKDRNGEDSKYDEEIVRLAIRIACLFGKSGINKQDKNVYFLNIVNDDEIIAYPANKMLNSTALGVVNSNLYISNKIKPKTNFKKDDFYVFTWRTGDIGDFIWCMKDILKDIYFKAIIECNTSNLTTKIFYHAKNLNTIKDEINFNKNPFISFGVIYDVGDVNDVSERNTLFENNKTSDNSHMPEIIESYKHHQEYYYNKYGREITSVKDQSISADASLSINSSRLIAQEHDRRILHALKQMGIEAEIDKEETPPQNENADKGGMGKNENTDGTNNKDKAGL